jgi:hypothetical protein
MARKLATEAAGLADLAADQPSMLAGAERCIALTAVLRAAGVLDAELATMTGIAARGFREAVQPDTAASFGARVAAVDRALSASV